jgi:hypothetical protein
MNPLIECTRLLFVASSTEYVGKCTVGLYNVDEATRKACRKGPITMRQSDREQKECDTVVLRPKDAQQRG